MDEFYSLKSGNATYEIERSEFIAYAYFIESELEADSIIKSLRKKHYDSTHVCYAYICDSAAMNFKFSDDGEPQGTAGQPILEVIKNNGLRCTLIAVVRYFGGIKLGAGGLVRAYTKAAADVVTNSIKQRHIFCDRYSVKLDYSQFNKISKNLSNPLCKISNIMYNDYITFIASAPKEIMIDKQIIDALCKKAEVNFLDSTYEIF